MDNLIWLHDEQRYIPVSTALYTTVICKYCGCRVTKYIRSHYTGGEECVVKTEYCMFCHKKLEDQRDG